MKKKLPLASLALAAVFSLGVVAAPVTVVAQSLSFQDKQQYIKERKEEWAAKKEEMREKAEQRAAEIKAKAEERAKEAKEKADAKKLEARKNVCEEKSEKLGQLVEKRAQTARAFYERFSGFSDKVERFVNNKELDVENYPELYANVEEASTTADAAIFKLEELKFEVDCEEVDLTKEYTQEYRDALVEARDALKVYKTSLVSLLRGVVTSYNASQSSDDATEQSSEESSEVTDEDGSSDGSESEDSTEEEQGSTDNSESTDSSESTEEEVSDV